MKKRTKYIVGVLLVGIISMYILNSFGTSDTEIQNPQTSENDTNKKAPVWVEVTEVVTGDITVYISEVGITKANRSVVVSSEASGRAVRMDWEVGDIVQAGDTIVYIDDELVRLALSREEAQLINSTAMFEKSQKDLERYRILLANEVISESEFEVVRLEHELARSTFLRNEADVKTARRQLRNTRITSPIDGYIAEKLVEAGTTISVNQPVAKVVDIVQIKIEISVSESDIAFIQKDSPVIIRVDAYPGLEFSGSVYSISPEAHSDTHSFPVEIIARNNQEKFMRSGMVVRVKILKEVYRDITIIPLDAVIERFGDLIVYVLNGTKAQERIVLTGLEKDDRVQILSGLQPGESVIVVGQYNLEDGTSVRVK